MSNKETISMIIYSIYKIVNTLNGKVYVGMTKKLNNKRFKQHICLSKGKSPQLLIQKKIKELGTKHFCFDIIFQTKNGEHAKEMESHFILEYNCLAPHGYNIHKGGNYSYVRNTPNELLQRMLNNNPGKTKESLEKKTSVIQAKNVITNETLIIKDRKLFSEKYNIPYPSIGWAIQNEKTLKNGWQFTYVKKRTMGA
jgi:group I intron endonuclease